MNICGTSSNLYDEKNCDLSVTECLHCVVLEEQLHSALEEVESTKLIIKLLKNEVEEGFPQDDRAVNPPSDMSVTVSSNESANNKWTISTAKCHKRVSSTKKLAEVSLANRYEQLTLRRLMSYIYGAPILDVSRSHTTQHSR